MSYSKYLELGGTIKELDALAEEDDYRPFAVTQKGITQIRSFWDLGQVYRIQTNMRIYGLGAFIKVRTIKVGPRRYRYADTLIELKHIAVLHGVYREDAFH